MITNDKRMVALVPNFRTALVYYFSILKPSPMRIRLAVAAFVNSIFINVQANMAAVARRIDKGILFTNHKSPSIHSVSVPISRSKAIAFSLAE